MIHRTGMFVLLALWTLIVAPSTCGGGLLAHACAADEAPACGHESDCPSDPCTVAHDVTAAGKAAAGPAVDAAPAAHGPAPRIPLAPAAGPVADADGPPLPLPAAALPLRC